MDIMKTWYAVQMDGTDNDWGTGSFDYNEAVKMAREDGAEIIAVVQNGCCVKVIYSDNF